MPTASLTLPDAAAVLLRDFGLRIPTEWKWERTYVYFARVNMGVKMGRSGCPRALPRALAGQR